MKDTFRLSLVCVLAAALVGVTVPALAALKKAPPAPMPSTGLAPAAGQMQVRQPDLAVGSLAADLVSTTKGQPGVEFPIDKLKISGIVKDIGPVKSPAAFKVKLFRNSSLVATNTIAAPAAAGQSWTLVHEETFDHGQARLYRLVIEADFPESSTENNKRDLGLSDQVLHSRGRQESTDTSVVPGGVQVPGSVIILF